MTYRSEIRSYVADALQALAPAVFAGRGHAVAGTQAERFIVVYIPKETSETQTLGSRRHIRREATLVVEYCELGTSGTIEGNLDDKSEEIALVLARDPKLGGIVDFLDLSSIETTVTTEDGSSKPLGVAQLTFNLAYRTLIEVI